MNEDFGKIRWVEPELQPGATPHCRLCDNQAPGEIAWHGMGAATGYFCIDGRSCFDRIAIQIMQARSKAEAPSPPSSKNLLAQELALKNAIDYFARHEAGQMTVSPPASPRQIIEMAEHFLQFLTNEPGTTSSATQGPNVAGWTRSRNGNWNHRYNRHLITVFHNDGDIPPWGFGVNGEWSKERFEGWEQAWDAAKVLIDSWDQERIDESWSTSTQSSPKETSESAWSRRRKQNSTGSAEDVTSPTSTK